MFFGAGRCVRKVYVTVLRAFFCRIGPCPVFLASYAAAISYSYICRMFARMALGLVSRFLKFRLRVFFTAQRTLRVRGGTVNIVSSLIMLLVHV